MATPLKKLSELTRRDLRGLMSPATVRRRVQRRQVPHRRIAGKIFLEAHVLEELLEGRAVPAAKSAPDTKHER